MCAGKFLAEKRESFCGMPALPASFFMDFRKSAQVEKGGKNWLWTNGVSREYNPVTTQSGTEVVRIGSLIPMSVSLVLSSIAMGTDLKSGRIPNGWIAVGLAAGITCKFLSFSKFGWGGFLLGMLIPLLLCWIPFRMGAMGAGDVKLFLVLGALNGGQSILYCIFFSFLFAAVLSLGKLLRLRTLRASLAQLFHYFKNIFLSGEFSVYPGSCAKGHTIHFAVAIFFGYVVWMGVCICNMLR